MKIVTAVTLTISVEDAEPILHKAAENAARYSSYVDYIPSRNTIVDRPSGTREYWQEQFLKAKRMVEAFGVEYEQVSEEELFTTYIPTITLKSHLVKIGNITMEHVDKHKPEPNRKKWLRQINRGVHSEACIQAASRVVRKWKEAHP